MKYAIGILLLSGVLFFLNFSSAIHLVQSGDQTLGVKISSMITFFAVIAIVVCTIIIVQTKRSKSKT